jgi:hypothetical protein
MGQLIPLHPGDPRVQRVAAVLWKLVNRLDPSLITASTTSASSSTNGGAGTSASAAAANHPMLREGAHWTVHVIDSPEINASVG